MQLHHVGICCKDIKKEIINLRKYHPEAKATSVVYDELQEVELCLITLGDGTNLELVSGDKIQGLIKKGIKYYHICYEVDEIERELYRLVEQGALIVSPLKPALLFGNRRVAFVQVSYGLIELLERE